MCKITFVPACFLFIEINESQYVRVTSFAFDYSRYVHAIERDNALITAF